MELGLANKACKVFSGAVHGDIALGALLVGGNYC